MTISCDPARQRRVLHQPPPRPKEAKDQASLSALQLLDPRLADGPRTAAITFDDCTFTVEGLPPLMRLDGRRSSLACFRACKA
jgi:hypothetical protein